MATHKEGGNFSTPENFEMGKIEKFDLKVVRTTVSAQIKAKLLNLNVGEGFTVAGVERDRISAPFYKISKDTGRRFTTHRIEPLKYRVVRVK